MPLIVETVGAPEGAAPDLVLIHGWAMHAGIFAGLAARLGAHFRVHLVELPGHGRNRDDDGPLDPAACAARLLAEAPAGALWVGWSLGGLIALRAALDAPGHVRGLAMLCASPRFVRGEDWRHGVSAEIFQDFAGGLAEDYRGTLDRFLALEAFGAEHMKEALRALRAEVFALGEPAAAALVQGLAVLESGDLRAELPRLAVPSLWLAGRRDRLVDHRAMAAAAEAAPDARFLRFEHAGHAPFLTEPEAVADALADFARSLPR
ncbi:pimeloyl-ACP methyl ester esterase BioH [Coralloluteibacterium thermophilus]|uniref:Pimeloyl-[acyl-carrier protein] methyl ester esterase n=1 Tax=Coralloluteibacterium thermophilum TaxID=2707049 RepID=A0ABV9NH97_9GAMM